MLGALQYVYDAEEVLCHFGPSILEPELDRNNTEPVVLQLFNGQSNVHSVVPAIRIQKTNEDTDVLANFKSTAERLETSEMKVWATFFEKQIQSIYAHLKNANLKKSEPIHSRFADVINYCYLGYALFVERDGKKKIN